MRRSIKHLLACTLFIAITAACNSAPNSSPTPVRATTASATQPASSASTSTIQPINGATSTPAQPVPPIGISAVTGITARLNEPFTLGWSQWATLTDAKNTRVFFTSILEDTRCAIDINCFQAGNTRVAITVESDGKLGRFDLSARTVDYRRVGSFNGYLVEFQSVAPARTTTNIPIEPKDYRVTLRVSTGSLNVSQARINEPFTLKIGQRVPVANTDAHVTFESVAQDSRCPTSGTCATSGVANVVIAIERGGKTDRLTMGTTPDAAAKRSTLFNSDGIYLNAVTPYPQKDFASKEILQDEYEATLVFVNYLSSPAPTTASTPSASGCPDLTRGEAGEILNEPIQEQPAQMSLFAPPTARISMRGLCGYGSVAAAPSRVAQPNLPYVSPVTIKADRAVIAGKMTGQLAQEQLLSIVSAIDSASSRGSSNLYNKLLTEFAAGGSSRDALNEIPDAARGVPNVHVQNIPGMGDKAVWVWREYFGGRYAALAAQKGETLYVITAMVNAQRIEDNTLNAMIPVMQKMLR